MTPRPDVSAERKSQIVEAAIKVFAKHGFKEATMDDIVAESRLSKGALYWYFKSKDEIIGAILEYIFKREIKGFRDLLADPAPTRERLCRLAEYVGDDLQKMKPLLPIFYEFYALAMRNKRVRQALQLYIHEYVKILEPFIQQGVERGEFRPVATEQTAVTICALMEGILLLWVLDPKTIDYRQQLRNATETILSGLVRQ